MKASHLVLRLKVKISYEMEGWEPDAVWRQELNPVCERERESELVLLQKIALNYFRLQFTRSSKAELEKEKGAFL